MTEFPGDPVVIELELRLADDKRGPKFKEVGVKMIAN